jgi:hypothetical protein
MSLRLRALGPVLVALGCTPTSVSSITPADAPAAEVAVDAVAPDRRAVADGQRGRRARPRRRGRARRPRHPRRRPGRRRRDRARRHRPHRRARARRRASHGVHLEHAVRGAAAGVRPPAGALRAVHHGVTLRRGADLRGGELRRRDSLHLVAHVPRAGVRHRRGPLRGLHGRHRLRRRRALPREPLRAPGARLSLVARVLGAQPGLSPHPQRVRRLRGRQRLHRRDLPRR